MVRPSIATHRFARWLAATLWATATFAVAQQAPEDLSLEDVDYAQWATRIDATTRALEAVRRDLKRSRFDSEALLDELFFDIDPAVAFVRDEIAFQPYEGVLRGVEGTLRARAGNSLDQSILLASLLKSAGFDARVVRGTLPDDAATALLRSLAAGERAASLDYMEPSLEKNFAGVTAAAPKPVPVADTESAATTRRLAAELGAALEGAGVTLAPVDVQPAWLPMAKTYFWVQHRDGPAGDWQDAHPALGGAAPPAGLEPEEYFDDTVPEKYQHTLTVAAYMEQWVAGSIEKHALMTPWTRPVANLDGVAITYRNAPSGLNLESLRNLEQAVQSSQLFFPTFMDANAPGAMAFDLKGRAIDPMAVGAQSGGMAGIFQTMGNAMEQATTDLMDREDGQPALALHSMWLEFTFTTPGGETSTQRRYVVAPREDHAGPPETLLWPLITQHIYLVNTGGQPLDYLAERYLATAVESNEWLKAMAHEFLKPDEGTPLPDVDLSQDFPPLAQYWLMDDDPTAPEGVVAFRQHAGLMGLRRGFRDADTAFAGVDIVANRVEHVRVTATGIERAPAAALSRGVWDTVLEALPQKALSVEAASSASAVEVFRRAREQGIDTVVVRPGDDAAVDGLGLDAAAAGYLRADLAQGYAVLVPGRVPEGAAQAGWWRVHPATGETLGMTGDGHGQDVVEYLTEVVGIAFNMVQAVSALKACTEKNLTDLQKMCCLVEANLNNVAGLGFGGIMGATVGTAGAAMFDILNFATTEATAAMDKASGGKGEGKGLMPAASLGCEKMQTAGW